MVKAIKKKTDNVPPEIWLADDNEDFWETIKLVLEPDYSIRCFATLPETEEALERGPLPKILLLDCRFYGDDEAGLKFLKKIRPKWPVLPIIMVSALDKQSTAFSNIAGFHQSKYVEKTPAGFVATLKNTVAEAFPKSSLNMDLENRLCCTNLIWNGLSSRPGIHVVDLALVQPPRTSRDGSGALRRRVTLIFADYDRGRRAA